MKHRDGLVPPGWLNGQTVAIGGAVLTVGLGIGAMVFSSSSSIRGEVKATRLELRTEIKGLDVRSRVVEQAVAAIQAPVAVVHPVTRRASRADREADDADA